MASKLLIGGAAAAVIAVVAVGGVVADRIESRARLEERVAAMTGGDPDRGRQSVMRRACGGCHSIPGVPGAEADVGPPLEHFARRAYIGGRLTNAPDNLVRWIMNPHAVDPESAMPPMGIGEAEARDIAAFLYTQQ